MDRKRCSAVALVAVACALLPLSGCTIKAGVLTPSAHFVYPNSNVEPLGQVTATKGKTGFFAAPYLKDQELEALYRSALAQKGGDVLINVNFETSVTQWFILPVMSAKYTITGVAAKMTVGKQQLTLLQEQDLNKLRLLADARGATAGPER
jgi:hypothetical protein